MNVRTEVYSGAVAAESDQFAQVRGVSAEGFDSGPVHWGPASFGLGMALLHMPEFAAETIRVKLGRVEFKT